jgi:hypothetical protein
VNLRDVRWRAQSSPVAKAVVRQVLDLRSIWAETAQLSPVSLGGACVPRYVGGRLPGSSVGLGLIAYGTDVRGCYSLLTETWWPRGRQSRPPADGTFQGGRGLAVGDRQVRSSRPLYSGDGTAAP